MNKIVPFQTNYETVKKIGGFATYLLYFSVVISVLVLFIDRRIVPNKNEIQFFLNSLLAIISVVYFFSDIIQNYLFQLAESNRKVDLIDNSFNTKMSEKNSSGYFSNDNIETGITKLGVNCFENSFFTKSISKRMLFKETLKCLLIILLFIMVAIYADNKMFLTILQIALPFSIFQQTFKLFILHNRVNHVFFSFKHIFSNVTKQKRNSLIIDNILSYEKIVSWACITLDSKIFKKYNSTLSEDWERIKAEHSL